MKKFTYYIFSLATILCTLVACEPKPTPEPETDPNQLGTPVLTIAEQTENSFKITWDAVENAESYTVFYNETTADVQETEFSAADVQPGTYTVKVKAVSTNEKYTDSEWAETSVTIKNGENPDTFTVGIEVSNIGQTTADVKFVPSDDETEYFAKVITLQELVYMGIEDDDIQIKTFLTERQDYGMYITTKTKTIRPSLNMGEEHIALAFDLTVDYLTDDAKLFKNQFKALDGVETNNFGFGNLTVGTKSVSFTVTPDDSSKPYYYRIMPKADFERYGSNAMMNARYGLNNEAIEKGYMNVAEYLRVVAFKGTNTITDDRLKLSTEYVAMVFYVDLTDEDPAHVYDWNYSKLEFTTNAAVEAAPTIEVKFVSASNSITYPGYCDVVVNIKVSDNTKQMKCGYRLFDANLQYYWDEGIAKGLNPWEYNKDMMVGSMVKFLSSTIVEAAKAADGYDHTVTCDRAKVAICVSAFNEEGAGSYDGVIVDVPAEL